MGIMLMTNTRLVLFYESGKIVYPQRDFSEYDIIHREILCRSLPKKIDYEYDSKISTFALKP